MHPVLFQWGGLRIYSYGLFVALGVIVATLLMIKKVEKEGRDPQFVVDLVLILVVAGIIGARLAYIILYQPAYFLTHPWQILMVQQGGLAFYGGLIFGLLAAYIYLKRKRISYLYFLDLASPALGLGYAVARIGCLLNGCCYGQVTTLPWGIVFPVVDDLPRQPTQIYSMLAGLLIFLVLSYRVAPRARFRGQVFASFLIIYGITRSVIELFRENDQLYGGPGIASLFALGIAVVGLVLYFYCRKRGESPAAPLPGLDSPPDDQE